MPNRRENAQSRLVRALMIGLLALLVSGCQQIELYSNLSEREGNEILAVLLGHNIAATKSRAKEFVTISVPKTEVAYAIEILRRQGFPREQFSDLGQIFQKQGLISSPMEERVRYTYGLSQMLAETLTQIDGVLSARVLIVLPEAAVFGQPQAPSSASVFVKYLPGVEIEEAIPRIKTLVQNSVDGLSYDKISVALFPHHETPRISGFGSQLETSNISPWLWVAVLLGLLLILSSGASAYLWWRMRRSTVMKIGHDA
ncbi:type III secretion system inner membrane ring lipoprotein SctJ [uncultured Thiocystis sp.]|jgi:type III secretion protein J|uniref:type III secretion system inner membrane ring lipoprotein SctJ n=1 Tax=uncultured Thiocystis sp. TaxID=1202134 RepID=UPI0025CE2EFD|nr:type III secretion inner membrane ring lipoprotein SctJ [uncultured Thiocystis sp.]